MPYLNLNHEKRIQKEINIGVGFKGRWNVEIINPDRGTSYFPLGEDMKDNLLTQSFYDLFVNLLSSNSAPSPTQLIANATAVIGDGNTAATILDYKLANQVSESSFTVPSGDLCGQTEDDTINGSRTFYRQWDFTPDLDNDRTIKEAGFTNPWETYVSLGINVRKLFSRFVFPVPISIPKSSILRLKYSLTCRVPAIVTPMEISISYGDFVGNGYLKLTGIWDSIFGKLTADGKDGYSSSCSILPITKNYTASWFQDRSSGAIQVSDFFTNFPTLNYPIDNINFENEYRSRSATQFIGSAICKGSMDGDVQDLPASGGEKGCRYLFGPLNPEISTNHWGGIFFFSRFGIDHYMGWPDRVILCEGNYGGASQSWNPSYTVENKPSYFNLTQALWFWKFKSPQTRYTDQSIEIELRQYAITNP